MRAIKEIGTALKELPLPEAQKLAQWLQKCLGQQTNVNTPMSCQESTRLPRYAARRRLILGDKNLPKMVMLNQELERW